MDIEILHYVQCPRWNRLMPLECCQHRPQEYKDDREPCMFSETIDTVDHRVKCKYALGAKARILDSSTLSLRKSAWSIT